MQNEVELSKQNKKLRFLHFWHSSQHFWMITSHLGGGIFSFAFIFQNGYQRIKPKQKVVHLSEKAVSMLTMLISNYTFCCGVEPMYEITQELRGDVHMVEVKVNLILAK